LWLGAGCVGGWRLGGALVAESHFQQLGNLLKDAITTSNLLKDTISRSPANDLDHVSAW
jgi:hypothetical protein